VNLSKKSLSRLEGIASGFEGKINKQIIDDFAPKLDLNFTSQLNMAAEQDIMTQSREQEISHLDTIAEEMEKESIKLEHPDLVQKINSIYDNDESPEVQQAMIGQIVSAKASSTGVDLKPLDAEGGQIKKEEKLGFMDKWKDIDFVDLVPFLSGAVEIKEIAELSAAAYRLKDNKATIEDMSLLKEFIEKGSQDTDFWYKVLDVVSMLPAFAGEFYLTGGIYRAGAKAAEKTAVTTLKKLLGKNAKALIEKKMVQLGIKSAAGVVGGTLQTPVMGGLRIASETIERTMPELQLSENEKGEVVAIITGEGESLLPAMTKAFGNQWVETVSEHSGGLFLRLGKEAKNTAIKHGILKSFFKANPNVDVSKFKDIVTKFGYHGIINEMLEERVGEVGRGVLGLEPFKIPSLEQLMVELTAFSIPGVMINVANRQLDKVEQQRIGKESGELIDKIEEEIPDEAKKPSEAEKPLPKPVTEPTAKVEQKDISGVEGREIKPKQQVKPEQPEPSELTGEKTAVQKKIKAVEESISKIIGKEVPENSIIVEEPIEERKEEAEVAKSISKIFRQEELVFVSPQNSEVDMFNGVIQEGTIFLNNNSDNLHYQALGHEIPHKLKTEHPDLYKNLEDVIAEDKEAFESYKSELGENVKKVSDEKLMDEFVGDTVGERFTNSEFWQKLYDKSPETVQKIAEYIKNVVDKLGTNVKYSTSQYFKDIKKINDTIDDVMGQYRERAEAGKVVAKPIEYKDKDFLTEMRSEIDAGEALKGTLVRDEEGKIINRFGAASTFPDYFKRKGLSKKNVLKTIDKALKNEQLTDKQKSILNDLIESRKELIEKEKKASPEAKTAETIEDIKEKSREHKVEGDVLKDKEGNILFQKKKGTKPELTKALFDLKDSKTKDKIKAGAYVYRFPDTGAVLKVSTYNKIRNKPEQVALFAIKDFKKEQEKLAEGKKEEKKAVIPEEKIKVESEQKDLLDELKGQRALFSQKRIDYMELEPQKFRQKVQQNLQDSLNRLEQVQKSIGKIPENIDAYMEAELFPGATGELLKDFENYLREGDESFLARLSKAGFTLDDFGIYLYAAHAPSRNKVILERSEGKIKNGSGMTNEQAEKILNDFEDTNIETYANEFYKNVTEKKLDLLLENKMITDDTYTTLKQQWDNYVPLKGKAGKKAYSNIGKGFSVTGKDIKTAKGRESLADNPFIRSIVDYADTVVRIKKNEVGKTLLKLIQQNPNPEVWEWKKVRYVPRYDKFGETIYLEPIDKPGEDVVVAIVDAKPVHMTIHDEALLRGIKNIGVIKSIPILREFNNFKRDMVTKYSPYFPLRNFIKDLGAGMIKLVAEHGAGLSLRVLNDIPFALNGVWNIERGDIKTRGLSEEYTEWAKEYEELRKIGGKASWFDVKSVEEKVKHLNRHIRRYKRRRGSPVRLLKFAGSVIEDFNISVEMAIRLSTYKHLKAKGLSEKKAAQWVKNMTVNFNKKGMWGGFLNAYWIFSNASIQGTTVVMKTIGVPGKPKTTGQKRAQVLLGGLMGASFLLNWINRQIDEEDFEQMSDYNKDSNILFMIPGIGKALALITPYGYNIFHAAANIAGDVVFGDESFTDGAKRLLNAVDTAVNPASGGTISHYAAPTILTPVLELNDNVNFFGGPIRPEQPAYQPEIPRSQLYFKGVRENTKVITDWINKETGGTEKVSGEIDVSPEDVDYIVDYFGGGIFKAMSDVMETGKALINKEDYPAAKNIPLVREFVKEPEDWIIKKKVYDMLRNSARQIYSDSEKKRFYEMIDLSVKNKNIERKKAVDIKLDFIRNQRKARLSLKNLLKKGGK